MSFDDADEVNEQLRVETIEEILQASMSLSPGQSRENLDNLRKKLNRRDLQSLEALLVEYQDKAQKANRKLKAEIEKNVFCYTCGTSWPRGYLACPACGGTDKSNGESRPTARVHGDSQRYMGPWSLVPWPRSGVVGMYGGPGAGKSSLAAMIRPKVWLTKEQIPKPVGEMFRRLWGEGSEPLVHTVESSDDVRRVLEMTYRGPLVLDSATALKLQDGLRASELITQWAQDRDDRALIIIQINKDGQSAGYMEIPHLVDAVVNISPDPWGVRAFRLTKSRWCDLGSTYWGFSPEGKVEIPDFPAAYSVEGSPGNYWLHPFPIRGSKWEGLLAAMSADECLEPRTASAAVRAAYMPHGFVEPMDVYERRRFAEGHGLQWLHPQDFKPKKKDKESDEPNEEKE